MNHRFVFAGVLSAALLAPVGAYAQEEQGAAHGAAVGARDAGPVGSVVGGAVGGAIGLADGIVGYHRHYRHTYHFRHGHVVRYRNWR